MGLQLRGLPNKGNNGPVFYLYLIAVVWQLIQVSFFGLM